MYGQKVHNKIMSHEKSERTDHSPKSSGMCWGERCRPAMMVGGHRAVIS